MKTIYRTIDGIRLSDVQMQILTLLWGAGGEARVGEVATSRQATIRALRSLAKLSLISVVEPPPTRERVGTLGATWKPMPEKCGVWKLTKRGREIVEKFDSKRK